MHGWSIRLALCAALFGLALAGAGCAKRVSGGTQTSTGGIETAAEPAGPLEPIHVVREDLSDPEQRKIHIRLVVDADATDQAIDDLIRRIAAEESIEDGALWISVFLEGMDTNSVAYAFGIAQPGRAVAITHRESLQTYR
jgi:hypothetical protein